MTASSKVKERPAEFGGGLAAAVVVIIAALFSITDPAVLGALVLVVGAVPAIVTWAVNLARTRAQQEGA